MSPTRLFVVAMLVLVTVSAQRASAFCRITTDDDAVCGESGVPVFWSTACLSYAVDFEGSQWMSQQEARDAIDGGFGAWANVTCGGQPTDFQFLRQQDSVCATFEYNSRGGNVNTIAFLDPWVDPRNGLDFEPLALAITSVTRNLDTGEILDVDMLINDTSPLGDCLEQDPCTAFDLESIVTHEAGHFLGFDHSPFADATMAAVPPSVANVELRSLEQDDRNALCETYAPGSFDAICSEADFEPRGGLELNCEEPSDPSSGGGGCSATGPSSGSGAQLWAWLLVGLAWIRKRACSLRSVEEIESNRS